MKKKCQENQKKEMVRFFFQENLLQSLKKLAMINKIGNITKITCNQATRRIYMETKLSIHTLNECGGLTKLKPHIR